MNTATVTWVLLGAAFLGALVLLPGILVALCLRLWNRVQVRLHAERPPILQARLAVAPAASSGGRNVS